ncbi:MAG TPA: hypothetical protein VGH23_21065 [Rhizomicrobium sp.]|jgi:hypothetical protein
MQRAKMIGTGGKDVSANFFRARHISAPVVRYGLAKKIVEPICGRYALPPVGPIAI